MEQLVNFIIRPPRADYSPKNDLLDQEFMLKGRWYQRKDLEVINGQGKKLQCSHYVPLAMTEGKTLPCVIYCHGNSGCRADASEAAIILLPSNITVFTLDFSGSGLSEGEHVTLGCNEKDDLRAVVNCLRTDGNVSCIGLWGRSMGAVTSLMYGAEDPSIAGMVLDRPFSNLVDLMMELVDTYKYPFPKFTVKLAIQHMRRIIKKKANFDIMDLDTVQVAKCCFVPVLLGHAIDDDFIHPHHSERIYDAYVGDKNIIKFDGDHNSPRPQFYFDSITIFFHNVLNPPEDASDEQYFRTMHDYFDQDNWHNIHEAEYRNHNFAVPLPELATGSTEDAITQLRSRRPMSRTEVPTDISSQDKLFRAEENGSGFDLGPSSSRIYSSNLSNGYQRGQLIPSANDEEFIDYSFDSLSDIPCSMEDEKRMFMEAIIESLKDLEMRQPQDLPSNLGTATSVSLDAMDPVTADSNAPLETVGTSMLESNEDATKACTAGSNGASEAVGSSTPSSTNLDSTVDPALSSQGSHAMEPTSAKNSSSSDTVSGTACTSADGSSSIQDADMAAGTRATLIVQKNPASHIMDGLAHRWGLKFFRSNR
ncbi:uncharacterized protein LOC103712341 [Phoenix dactylifera]|uniref:Uncharacterized protein LOC103712341 n=1 Tax=Phoenix dactylifera TaxID=42345 RepID=A0A8B7CDL7_PHODC|nr:uncharacterized protein LOC103712341 [Phoenix dactylifera]